MSLDKDSVTSSLPSPSNDPVESGGAVDGGDEVAVDGGGAVDGGAVDGGVVDRGVVDGGAVDGGVVDGGAVDGSAGTMVVGCGVGDDEV